jgi:hypothetical protein
MSEEVDLDGFLTKRIGSSQKTKNRAKNFRYYYFNLIGGSLHYYKDFEDAAPKGTIELKNLKLNKNVPVPELEKTFGFCLANEKNYHLLIADDEADYNEWIAKIEANLTKDARPPLTKDKKMTKMQNALRKAKANLGNKLASTSVGQGILKTSLPDEITALISALRVAAEKELDAKKGVEVEKSILKLSIKVYFLITGGKLSSDDLLLADKPLRTALEMLSKCHDHARYSQKVNESLLKEKLEIVQNNLYEAGAILTKVLTPHLKPKNVAMVKRLLQLIGNAPFLFKLLMDNSLIEETHELITAGDHYCQFHFYPESK